MGMLNEMFGDGDELQPVLEGELLASGEYESHSEEILRGYKIYQKRYVYRSMIWKMLIVLLALTSSVMMILNAAEGEVMPFFCLMLTIFVGYWFISTPISNAKKLKRGLSELEGAKYRAEIYTDKIKISTCDMPVSGEDKSTGNDTVNTEEKISENKKASEAEGENTGESDEIPATIIHLDSPIVDFLEKEDMFILVVKKAYVFIIPKAAFEAEENEKIREKLSVIMGIRYKNLI